MNKDLKHSCGGKGITNAVKKHMLFYTEKLCPACWEGEELFCDVCGKKINFIKGTYVGALLPKELGENIACSKSCVNMIILRNV